MGAQARVCGCESRKGGGHGSIWLPGGGVISLARFLVHDILRTYVCTSRIMWQKVIEISPPIWTFYKRPMFNLMDVDLSVSVYGQDYEKKRPLLSPFPRPASVWTAGYRRISTDKVMLVLVLLVRSNYYLRYYMVEMKLIWMESEHTR